MRRIPRAMALILLLALGTPAVGAQEKSSNESQSSDGAWTRLFNGENLHGWTYTLPRSDAAMKAVWSVPEEGVLRCEGQPKGVLRTKESYRNYILELEWRWPGEGGNNGVLVHGGASQALTLWPRSLEVQLETGNAGDFWVIATEIDVPNEQARRDGRNIKRLEQGEVEKPLGQWNHIKVRCESDTVTVWINRTKVNHGENLTHGEIGEPYTSGAICLQSEGAPIEYRNIRLKSIE